MVATTGTGGRSEIDRSIRTATKSKLILLHLEAALLSEIFPANSFKYYSYIRGFNCSGNSLPVIAITVAGVCTDGPALRST